MSPNLPDADEASVRPIDKPPSGAIKPRFVALDSWRGICALAVALFHFPVTGVVASSAFVRHSYMFVDFFFVLSGFVIATVYEKGLTGERERRAFVIRRFGRLWPLHVTMLAVFVLFAAIRGQIGVNERHSVVAIFTNLVMIQGLGMHKDLTWNGPSWSISVEAFLYLVFVALSMIRWRLPIYVGLIVVGLLVLSFHAPQGMASTFDFGVFRGLAGFFTGAIVARFRLRSWGTLVELLTVILVTSFVLFGKALVLTPFVFAVPVYVFAGSKGWIGRALQLKPMAKLGEWSYSIYMVHAAVVAMIWAAAPRLGLIAEGDSLVPRHPWEMGLLAALYLTAIVAISAVTFTFVEAPARNAFNRLAGTRRRVAAPA